MPSGSSALPEADSRPRGAVDCEPMPDVEAGFIGAIRTLAGRVAADRTITVISVDPIAATDLEALLRRTLGTLYERVLGPQWQSDLPKAVRDSLARIHEVASRNRDGVPSDPWLSAGLAEIKAVVEHFAREHYERRNDFSSTDPDGLLAESLKDLGWVSVAQCQADFERLLADRHDTAHPGVVEPPAAAQREEAEALRQRLRLGCERVRRRLINADEEWFPYIETVHCPGIQGWDFERRGNPPSIASFVEGDEIEFVVSAVDIDGSAAGLRYGLYVQPDGGSFITIADDELTGRLRCTAGPPGRAVLFESACAEPLVVTMPPGGMTR